MKQTLNEKTKSLDSKLFRLRLLKSGRIAFRFGTLLTSLFLLGIVAHAATFGTDDKGVRVDSGSMGTFVLAYPTLLGQDGKESHKIIEKDPAGQTAVVKYDGGATLQVDASHGDQITYTFDQMPADVKNFTIVTLIDFSFAQGGKWKIGENPETSFPMEKPAKPHLFQGSETSLQLTNAQGESISFHIPDYSYEELTDNREWNWSIFAWTFYTPYNPDAKVYTVTAGAGLGATVSPVDKATPLIDSFGQIKALDWPNKVRSADELAADVQNEQAYYASMTPPTFDKFGGLPESKEELSLKGTGFFHVEKKNDKWFLADPDGNAFFHLGICGFFPSDDYTWIGGRQGIYEWLPPMESDYKTAYRPESGTDVFSFYVANTIRKYNKPYDLEDFQARMIPRVRKFGFNSIGAFSPSTAASHAANFPYVTSLPLDQWAGHVKYISDINETWDPFDEDNKKQIELNFAKSVAEKRDDPLLIGYYLSNEPLYEDIPKVVPSLKSTYACKRVLVQMLSDKYKTVEAFNTAWGMTAHSFDELDDQPLVVKTRAAYDDMHDYTGLFFETYFKLVADTFHKYDPNHMLIGNRFQPGTINNEQLCRIAGKYLDIMSFNYYTDAVDKDFLNRIYAWTGRPMFFSEFYWTSPVQSGLLGGSDLPTQQDRGLAYRNYVEQGSTLGYVVGIEWFTLIDQATTGRWFSKYNGERANTGLFSVADRPWKPMLAEMMKTNYGIYDVWLGKKAPFAFDNPRFNVAGTNLNRTASIPRATGPIKTDGTTLNWPGIPPEVISSKRVVLGEGNGAVEGTFKLCWDDTNLFILASVVDPTPMKNTNSVDQLWSGDGLEIFLGSEGLDQVGPPLFTDRHLLIGASCAGKVPFHYDYSPQQYPCETMLIPGSDGKSYTIEAAIPWEALGIKPQVGQVILFDIGINDSNDGKDRQAQLMWNGTAKNSTDRTHWGRAKLLP